MQSDNYNWLEVRVDRDDRIPELLTGAHILIRITSIRIVRHPEVSGIIKLYFTADYKRNHLDTALPLCVINNTGYVETEFCVHIDHSAIRDGDVGYWDSVCKRYITLNVLAGRYPDAHGFNLDTRISYLKQKSSRVMVSAPDKTTTVYTLTDYIHHSLYTEINGELSLSSNTFIGYEGNDQVVVVETPFVWGRKLIHNAMEIVYGCPVLINQYQHKRDN